MDAHLWTRRWILSPRLVLHTLEHILHVLDCNESEGLAGAWLLRCDVRPALDLQRLPQVSQIKLVEIVDFSGFFLFVLSTNIFSSLSFSKLVTALWQADLHFGRSLAIFSQSDRCRVLTFALSLSLYRSRGRPIGLVTPSSWPYKAIFGRRSSLIRITWPVHLSWFFMRRASIPDILHLVSTSWFVILSFYEMLHICLSFLMWKAFSWLICFL